MVVIVVLAVIATLFAGWRVGRRVRYFLHVFQLETYKFSRYGRWLQDHLTAAVARPSHAAGGGLLVLAALGFSLAPPYAVASAVLPAWALTFISSRRYRSDREKKPLAFTARMTRLTAATALWTLLPIGAGALYGWLSGALSGFFWYLLGLYAADLGAPLWVTLGAATTYPVEQAIQQGFKRQARQRLRERDDLTVIGITGSYGKTSTKFIVAELLRQKYNVCATPSSYNTPMGTCLVVNEKLRPEHQVLVLEMGIRYPGDIEELCRIAPPDLSIVTTVGIAHLETMGSVEAIAEEKGSILQHMQPGGPAVLNLDDERVAAMEARATGDVWTVSAEGNEAADISAHDVRYGPEGTSFRVRDETGAEADFQTQLLGAHNVLNVLLGIATGRAMGLRLRQMAHAIRRVEPVEHRLALRQNGGITIIDDAFNSNPVGARNAVELLSQMETDGRRVIVTPGMVELGARQAEENRALGTHIAAHGLDLAVLVGEAQTAPIRSGLRAADYPDDRTKVFATLFEAQDFLNTYLQPGDIVLYENDLPDQYEVAG
jgi:UDP-N-acetylmuramoyl-tripeptide--D-alanyl-D-alanine ligase